MLHDQLLAAQHSMHRPQGGPIQQHLQPNTASPRDQANIDPAISGAMMAAAPQTPTQPQQGSPDDVTPKSYGKRELSTSKRAAQNRAAQVCGGSPLPLSETQLTSFTACFPPAQGNLHPKAGS